MLLMSKQRWQSKCMVLFMILQKLSLIYSEILAMTSGVLAETINESLVLAFFTMYIFFHEGFLNIRRKIYSIMKGNQSTTTYYWNANIWRKRIWLIMRKESEHEHRRKRIFEGKATRWRRAGLGYNIGHHVVHGSR